MPKNYAVAVGVNEYEFIKPLRYAKYDAEAVNSFLLNTVKFERVFFFSDDSPTVGGKSTRPSRSNLLRVLRQICAEPFMSASDSFWFFFSGHGIRYSNQDYLMPADGDPEDVEKTAISVSEITKSLRISGAGNLFLILDACRSDGPDVDSKGSGVGTQTAKIASSVGVVSIFSCTPEERSYEIEELKQGSFTHAFIQGLIPNSKERCSTISQLDKYLRNQVPKINSLYNKPLQNPYTAIEPLWKSNLFILPELSSDSDIEQLRSYALEAETNDDFECASQVWRQLLTTSKVDVEKATQAIERLARKRAQFVSEASRLYEGDKSTAPSTTLNNQKAKNSTDKFDSKEIVNDRNELEQKKNLEIIQCSFAEKILIPILSSIEGSSRLRLDQEIREIKESILESRNRDRITLEECSVASIDDIKEAISKTNSSIVHFCGDGAKGGLTCCVEDEVFQSRAVSF